MDFTRYHSLQEILDVPYMEQYLKVFFSEDNLALFTKEMKNVPLALAEHVLPCPWGGGFFQVINQLLDAVHTIQDITIHHTRRCISLWDQAQDWTLEQERKGGKASVFLLAPEYLKTCGHAGETAKRPAVILCPGGGYEQVCCSGEGSPVMNYMEAKGYAVFLLRYRTAPARYPAPQEDLALAMQYVREHAQEYGADAQNILLMGFSAGGHLCASFACFYEQIARKMGIWAGKQTQPHILRPDKLCLAYPVISFLEECHEGSFLALTGGEESMRETLSLEKQVTDDFPPAFLWACADDDCVPPSNAARLASALKEHGIRHQLRVYPTGGHGCNLAFGNSAKSWTQEMISFMEALN